MRCQTDLWHLRPQDGDNLPTEWVRMTGGQLQPSYNDMIDPVAPCCTKLDWCINCQHHAGRAQLRTVEGPQDEVVEKTTSSLVK